MTFDSQILNDFYKNKEVKINKNAIAELNKFNDENIFGFVRDTFGKKTTILHVLCRNTIPQAFELFDRLADLGANVNAVDGRNNSVLDVAIDCQQVHFVNLIVNHKNFNGSEKVFTETMKKIQFMNPVDDDIYEVLKSKGGKIAVNHVIDNLIYMTKSLVIKYVYQLVNEMDVDINYVTPTGSYIIKQMIMNEDKSEYNSDAPKPKTNYKDITLWDKVYIFLESDPTINISRLNHNNENLMWNVIASELYTDRQKWTMITSLHKFGLDINCVNKDGENILYTVASNSYLLSRLLDMNINPIITNKKGITLLEKILESYATVHSDEYDNLLKLCKRFCHQITDINKISNDKDKNTMLHRVLQKYINGPSYYYESSDIVKMLKLIISIGAKLDIPNGNGILVRDLCKDKDLLSEM